MTPRFEDHRTHATAIWKMALAAVDPREAVRRAWDGQVAKYVGGKSLKLLAVGKASIEMALGACECISNTSTTPDAITLRGGLVTAVPERLTAAIEALLEHRNVRAMPADHPLPTHRNLTAAREVGAFLKQCTIDETLLVLLSGGGSAHLACPVPGVSLDELSALSSDLMKSGATIAEINAVRKHVERLKGGRSAALCNVSRVIVLVLSDVVGDPLDVIASGPFAPDPTTFADAWRVLETRKLPEGSHEAAGLKILMGHKGLSGQPAETPKPGDAIFRKVSHTVIANNATAVYAVEDCLSSIGFVIGHTRTGVEGESALVAHEWIQGCMARCLGSAPAAHTLGGETTVAVGASIGLGGPSQEFALAGARALAKANLRGRRAALLTFSTDGVDGPTDAAGAIVTDSTWGDIARAGIDPAAALANHDSHRALDTVGALIRTGPTGTNVNHVAVLMVYDR